ncbi:MAG TPA: PQQ-binding-like beta-propeller repeat protein [Pirellulales bacterium]|nr:PQQ-binding-like beta-propeller repeat protein [Pirellulales bacterium]
MIRLLARALFPAALLLLARVALADGNWPEFRGPQGDGHADAAKLPLTWSETEHVRWKTPIHDRGWSSPVIWGNQIWLTTATKDGKQMYAVQVNRETGKIERDILLFSPAEPAFCHPYNSYASCTPAIEEGRVYIHFGSYGTAAIDTKTGKTLWQRTDLPCDHFRGPGSSPIIWNNLLVLTFDGFDFNYLVALDKQTGENVWRTDRKIHYDTDDGDYHKAYSTPTVVKVDGHEELISPSAGATTTYDPASGRELWRVQSGGMNAAARPLFGHGLAFATTAYQGYQLFAVRPGGKGEVSDSHVVWKFPKSVPSRSSPLLVGDHLFMVADKGIASCIDARTGEALWQKRIPGEYTSSPIFASGRIYFFNEDGRSPVVAPDTAELKVLAENRLDEGCMASPAISGNAMYLRTKTDLYRIEE